MNIKNQNDKDFTQYCFNNKIYGKGRLVLAVVKEYINKNSNTTFSILNNKIFPQNEYYGAGLVGVSGVVNTFEYAEKLRKKQNKYRYFIKDEEQLLINNEKCVVTTEWGIGNIDIFIAQAKKQGFDITKY